jgi:hypothetical protein
MKEKQTTGIGAWVVVSVATLLLVILTTYVAGYFLTGECEDRDLYGEPIRVRSYPAPMHVALYRPLGKLEAVFIGHEVRIRDD